MSNRGRGRGNSGVKPNDRSSSSSSAASSRSSSLTRPTTTSTIQDADRLRKELTNQLNAGSASTTGRGGNTRPASKFIPNFNTSKKGKDKTDSTLDTPSSSSNNNPSSINKKDTINGNKSQRYHGGNTNYRENYIQIEGIFQGNAQIPVASTTSSSYSRISSTKTESSASNPKVPNIKKLGTSKIVTGDVDGLKYEIEEEYEPRQIPIAERKSIFDRKKEPDVTHKTKEAISTDSEHIHSFIQLFSQQKLESSTKSIIKDEPMEQNDLPKPEELINDPSQLILMQFPDVLPCTRTSSSSTKPELASLNDLPDGFLGKLQIYKSGKCRLKLNDDTYLDVDIGQPTSFLQNVMVTEMASPSTNTNNDMNKLVCLGDIKHKLIVSLDVDHVLQDTKQ